ncbi:MAG TPA: DUF1972 domain-containing protein [Bacteroidales bacterium]|nr:DUF1972 domain-containing protein [Bacteroidales bacterium]
MKIAILGTRGIPNRYGGFERFAEEVAHEFSKLGHQVFVSCPSDKFMFNRLSESVFTVHLKVPKVFFPNLGTLYYDYISLRWAQKNHADVIIECGHSFSPLLIFFPRTIRNRIVTNPDGIEHKRRKWSFFAKKYLLLSERLAFMFSAQIVCDNRALVEYYSVKYIRNLIYIPYGAHPLENTPSKNGIVDLVPKDDYYLLISRITPENNIKTTLNYFAQSGKLCLIVGGLTSKYARRIKRLFAGYTNIIFMGAIYDQQVLNSLRYYCKAYIHGHSAGGTNPSLLEAMACGCFVIAHNNPFNRDILGEQGLYFSNETSLGNCISHFEEQNDVEVNKVKEQNIQTIRRNFLWEKVALAYIEVIERLEK